MSRWATVGNVLLCGIALGSAGYAETIRVNYTGTISQATGNIFGHGNTDYFALGIVSYVAPVTGFFQYETNQVNQATVDPTHVGLYPSGPGAFSATIQPVNGPAVVVTGSSTPTLEVDDNLPGFFAYFDGPRTVGPHGGSMSVGTATDPTLQLLIQTNPSPVVLTTVAPPDPYIFTPSMTTLFTLTDPTGSLFVHFTCLTVVPEPASLVLCGLGALGLAVFAGRRTLGNRA